MTKSSRKEELTIDAPLKLNYNRFNVAEYAAKLNKVSD